MKTLFVAVTIAICLAGNAWAGFKEGAQAYNARQYARALKEITPLAKSGHADAQHLLGLMYYMGRGVARDYRQALHWHRKAAEQGKADAQYVVGAMYYTGNAVAADQRQAVAWFRRAAEKGHAGAQHALALMYRYHAAGLPQDKVLAYMLWSLAAAGGNTSALEQRAEIAKRMTPEQIEEALGMSRAWRPGTPLPTRSRTGENA
ncbi:sel1 repeat family protein [Massilia sp. PAMC28688]|uniref:tetratricopeptide repeat protein n=1 Tax=Massilia sp. PAMC28688 TaxID=2861283 RepID=UPI001C625EAD|nr:tetratricopeptide repeat protein [Massilia sp. PAMC28688]QYF92385.1 sel1 repeat family protein [Massilia sp. PAMC28688]